MQLRSFGGFMLQRTPQNVKLLFVAFDIISALVSSDLGRTPKKTYLFRLHLLYFGERSPDKKRMFFWLP